MSNQLFTYRPLPGARLNMAHPLTKGLVLCMLLNENGGYRAMDSSPYGNHGTLVGFGSPVKRPFNGLPFDGASRITTVANAVPTSTKGAFECWFSITDPTKNQGTISQGIDSANFIEIHINPTGGLRALAYIVSVVKWRFYTGDIISAGAFYHIIMTNNGVQPNLYVNGMLISITREVTTDETVWTSAIGANHFVSLGLRFGGTQNYLAGKEGLVRIWNRVLLPSDIQWLYQEPYDMILR